jgi:uncharacterized protein (DUF2235 family)
VNIEFIGVWDTVSSLGCLKLKQLPFAQGVQGVRFFRQALALDERRIRFQPEYIHYNERESSLWLKAKGYEKDIKAAEREGDHEKAANAERNRKVTQAELDKVSPVAVLTRFGQMKRRRVDLWFMGAHSDVGGSGEHNASSLSNIPFR